MIQYVLNEYYTYSVIERDQEERSKKAGPKPIGL